MPLHEDLEPDFLPEQLTELATELQIRTVGSLSPLGWRVSHLWGKDVGEIRVWMICRAIPSVNQKEEWVHGYIGPEGNFVRYNPRRG